MSIESRRCAGDPLAGTVVQRRASVQTGRDLHAHPRTTARHPRDKADVEFTRSVFTDAAVGQDARRTQARKPLPGGTRIRVLHRRHHAMQSGCDQCFIAGRCAAVVMTGFESDVGGGATRTLTSRLQGDDLGVRPAGARMPALANDLAVAHDDTTDTRIRRGRPQTACSQRQCACHVIVVSHDCVQRKGLGVSSASLVLMHFDS